MNDPAVHPSEEAWFRNGWVWFVLLIPFSAVAFGIVMLVSAYHQPDDLVVDNYYKEGMGINRRLEQDRRAVRLGARAEVTAVTDGGVVFRVSPGGESINLTLFHVTDRSLDLAVALSATSDNIYIADSPELAQRLRTAGTWYLEVSSDDGWRLRQRVETPLSRLKLAPSPERGL